jgi:ribosome-associated protein
MSEENQHLKQIIHLLEESQASEITVINVSKQTAITDYMIICTGRASRHIKAIADQIMEKMKAHGLISLSSTGLEGGDWALVDFGDFIVHVMQAESRSFYNLEGLWQDKP